MLTLSTKVRLPEPVPTDRTSRDLGDQAATGVRQQYGAGSGREDEECAVASRLNPYVSFPGTARSAAQFYQEVFGGEASVMTFADAGAADAPDPDQVMHAQLETPAGLLMLADMPPGTDHSPGNDIAISLSGDDAAELRGWWDRLSDGGTVAVPLEKQMWGDVFGMCTDRFGVSWMVNIAGDAA